MHNRIVSKKPLKAAPKAKAGSFPSCSLNISPKGRHVMPKSAIKAVSALFAIAFILATPSCAAYDWLRGGGEGRAKLAILEYCGSRSSAEAIAAFREEMAALGYGEGDGASFEAFSAQGDASRLDAYIRDLGKGGYDLIVAFSAKAAQEASGAGLGVPIVFVGVSDPVGCGLVNSLEEPGGEVTGVACPAPLDKQIALLKAAFPDLASLGILRSAGDTDAESAARAAQEAAARAGLSVEVARIEGASDAAAQTSALAGSVQAIYLPADELIASSVPLIAAVAAAQKIPILAADAGMVADGALLSDSIDYAQAGRSAARIAVRLLEGEEPANISVITPSGSAVTVNLAGAVEMGLSIPQAVLDAAKDIIR